MTALLGLGRVVIGVDKKRTKIVCTIGPSSSKMETLLAMLKAGMNVARINFSHGTHEDNGKLIRNVRAAAKALNLPVAVMQDLQGPRVRTSNVVSGGIALKQGDVALIATVPLPKARKEKQDKLKIFQVTYKDLPKDLKRGRIILIDDGLIKLKVLNIRGKQIKCRVMIGGVLTQGRGMNFPGTALSLPAITPKDRKDLEYGVKAGIDYVAISFVQRPEDIIALRRLIKIFEDRESPRIKIIAKIEKEGALDNFDAILKESDGVMVARGDLGIEMDPARLPLVQKEMVTKCLEAAKPVIVATQMLDSMQENPRPTRAEISDIAHAVIDHTDAVMLSQETATGKYPLEAVEFMARTCRETERSRYDDMIYHNGIEKQAGVVAAISRGACVLARDIKARAILVTTRSGFSVKSLVSHRPEMNAIVAATNSLSVYRELSLVWGVIPYLISGFNEGRDLIAKSIKLMQADALVKAGDKIVVMTGFKERGDGWSTSLRVATV